MKPPKTALGKWFASLAIYIAVLEAFAFFFGYVLAVPAALILSWYLDEALGLDIWAGRRDR